LFGWCFLLDGYVVIGCYVDCYVEGGVGVLVVYGYGVFVGVEGDGGWYDIG